MRCVVESVGSARFPAISRHNSPSSWRNGWRSSTRGRPSKCGPQPPAVASARAQILAVAGVVIWHQLRRRRRRRHKTVPDRQACAPARPAPLPARACTGGASHVVDEHESDSDNERGGDDRAGHRSTMTLSPSPCANRPRLCICQYGLAGQKTLNLLSHRHRAVISAFPGARHGFEANRLKRTGRVGRERAWGDRRRGACHLQDLLPARALARWTAGQDFVERRAQQVNIRALINVAHTPLRHFRRHVKRAAKNAPILRLRGISR